MSQKGIPECGIDALRFSLCNATTYSHTISININQIYGYRLFCNKIFNAVKFTRMYTTNKQLVKEGHPVIFTEIDRWIYSCLGIATQKVNECLTSYDFNGATNAIHNFWLHELCDYYIEAIKPILKAEDIYLTKSTRTILLNVIDNGLRLLHPFMPFITEELWQSLPHDHTISSIAISKFPVNTTHIDKKVINDFEYIKEVIHNIRTTNVTVIQEPDIKKHKILIEFKSDIETLTKKKLEIQVIIP